jgi:hypothetical protein
MAVISLDFSSVACCPSTIRCRAAQADTRCRGLRPLRLSWLRREVLPSMAMMSASASTRLLTQAWKQALNNSGSNAANTSHSVSWLGMPLS